MNAQTFYKIINNPSLLNKNSLLEFEELVSDYPHIENIRILYALNLLVLDDYRYKQQLTKAAFYASDRKKLKELITGIIEKTEEKETIPLFSKKPKPIDTQISEIAEEAYQSNLKTKGDKIDEQQNNALKPIKNLSADDAQIISQEKELIRNRKTKSELLKLVKKRLAEIENIKNSKVEQKDNKPSISNDDLINKFIEQQPSITRADKGESFSADIETIESSIDEDNFFTTETLARIHSDQGNHKKAIEIYKKLILKIPEKSIYFAARIEDLNKNKNKKE